MINKIRNKILFFATCAIFILCSNFVRAEFAPIDIKNASQEGSRYLNEGIKSTVELLKDFQKIIFNFYSTKIAPRVNFWARDLFARFKAGIISTISQKLSELWTQSIEKLTSAEIIKRILEFFDKKEVINKAGYWYNTSKSVL